MKFLIIGTGFIFPAHAQAIKEVGGQIVGVIDREKGENTWIDEVKDTVADCVVILTPNDLHFKMAKLSAEQDKIVLCEKPLVIMEDQARILAQKKNIFTVLQLRHHPLVGEIKKATSERQKDEVEMNIFFKRDENYAKGWKGDKRRSGGFLFNLGIHYFDLLLYLFGDAKKIETTEVREEVISGLTVAEAEGIVEGENYACNWTLAINKEKDGEIIKKREFIVNGKSYNFSSKDSLAEESLHKFVYQDLLKGKGILPLEALRSILLVEKIYQSYSPPHQP